MNLTEQLKKCRRAGVPLVAVETADPNEVAEALKEGLASPGLIWDCVRGLRELNTDGATLAANLNGGQDPAIVTGNPVEALRMMPQLPEKSVCLMLGSQVWLSDAIARQAAWNLRDILKVAGATIVMTIPLGYKLAPDLAGDVIVLTHDLPTAEALGKVSEQIVDAAGLKKLDAPLLDKVQDAVCGLSSFAAEQCVAMSLSKAGVDLDGLWDRKRKAIESTPGLSVWRGGETFDDVAGYKNAKLFFKRESDGRQPCPPGDRVHRRD